MGTQQAAKAKLKAPDGEMWRIRRRVLACVPSMELAGPLVCLADGRPGLGPTSLDWSTDVHVC